MTTLAMQQACAQVDKKHIETVKRLAEKVTLDQVDWWDVTNVYVSEELHWLKTRSLLIQHPVTPCLFRFK